METSRSEGHLRVIDWARWNGYVLFRFVGCFGECCRGFLFSNWVMCVRGVSNKLFVRIP